MLCVSMCHWQQVEVSKKNVCKSQIIEFCLSWPHCKRALCNSSTNTQRQKQKKYATENRIIRTNTHRQQTHIKAHSIETKNRKIKTETEKRLSAVEMPSLCVTKEIDCGKIKLNMIETY